MESLWQISNYEDYDSNLEETYIETRIQGSIDNLPKSTFPIRGTEGVEVCAFKSRKKRRDLIFEFINKSFLGKFGWRILYQNNKDYGKSRAKIQDYQEKLFEKFFAIPNLLERISESSSYKNYDVDELTERIKNEINDRYHKGSLDTVFPKRKYHFHILLVLSEILADELYLKDFAPENKLLYGGWDETAINVTEKIYSIAAKTHNKYEVVIFLNAPVIDSTSKLSFACEELDGISIEYVNDDLLSKLHRDNGDIRLGGINTAIKWKTEKNVNDTVEEYLSLYQLGSRLAETIVDFLRLIRDEDIGVIALEIFPVDAFTPHIRKTYAESYQPDLAILMPKRFYFQTEKYTKTLSQEELNHICKIFVAYSKNKTSNVKGLDVAIHRFRSSCERYFPNDPEKLLDIAFAFEAIFLNDDENKELSYRLRLRAAKLLGKKLEERQEIFDIVKNLYNFRSKIAHGETIDAMKPKDAEKLKQVLSRAPRILKDAIIEMLLGNAPRGLTDKGKIGDWWRKLELS